MVHCINIKRSPEFLSFYLVVCACVVCVRVVCATAFVCWSLLSSTFTWTPGMAFRQHGLPGKHLYMLIHLSSPLLIFKTQIIMMLGGAMVQQQ